MNLKKILLFAIGPLLTAILGVITLPLLSWFFNQEDIGRLSIFQAIISLSGLFFTLGLDQAYVREYHEQDNKNKLFKSCILAPICMLIILAFLYYFSNISASLFLFDVDSKVINFILISSILCYVLSHFLTINLRMQEKALAYSLSKAAIKTIFVLFLVFTVIFYDEYTFTVLLYLYLISYVISTLIIFIYNREFIKKSIVQNVNKKEVKHLLRLGFPLAFSGVAYWGLTSLDRFFLKEYSNFNELAIYSVAISFASAGTILQTIFSTVWAPMVYKWVSKGEGIEKISIIADRVLIFVLMIFSFIGMFSFIIDFFLPTQYQNVSSLVVICLSYPLLYTLSEVTKLGIGISRKSNFSLLATTLSFIINLVGNVFLIPIFGAFGAATSTAISFWVFLILRTEFSLYLWPELCLKKLKIYVWSIFPIVIAITLNYLNRDEKYIDILVWFMYMLTVIFLWWDTLKIILFDFKKRANVDS
ncbi:oligosaccharide flippase family protein [Vibrio chagasii]|uniref:Oligosaccharide flippase family protein n=1 Tax=Vibrio chagasii TaxID=170679 RepID=A0A7V7TIC1_9VIBR|nr:oligosaccharide flippase family protein [Vibrio chagasii]KAB0483014.1 oligosaccharide flippase family protein [Vibrio chagasii]